MVVATHCSLGEPFSCSYAFLPVVISPPPLLQGDKSMKGNSDLSGQALLFLVGVSDLQYTSNTKTIRFLIPKNSYIRGSQIVSDKIHGCSRLRSKTRAFIA